MNRYDLIGLATIPLAYACHYWLGRGQPWEPAATFTLSGISIIPLARAMGDATEHLAERLGPTTGGLLNATFGNAAELLIGLIALYRGYNALVLASLTGSILGNLLLVAGAAIVIGGFNREKQCFNKHAAEISAGQLVLVVGAMMMPAIFHFTYDGHDQDLVPHEHGLSLGTSVILLCMYGLGLLYTLRTHRHVFAADSAAAVVEEEEGAEETPAETRSITAIRVRNPGAPSLNQTSVTRNFMVLLIASIVTGFVAELLVGSAQSMAEKLAWSPIFVGVILLAIIGNAAEHATAVMLARHDDMDTALVITYQSSLQIALFVTPVMVLASTLMVMLHWGHATHLNLIFSPLEVAAMLMSLLIVIVVHRNGQTNWLEGAMLLALYAILGLAFFFVPA